MFFSLTNGAMLFLNDKRLGFFLTTKFEVLDSMILLCRFLPSLKISCIVSCLWHHELIHIGYGLYRSSPNNLYNVTVLIENPYKCTPHDITYYTFFIFLYYFSKIFLESAWRQVLQNHQVDVLHHIPIIGQ